MYGGNHYVTSATALAKGGVDGRGGGTAAAAAYSTPQGMAIKEAATKFGDGKTLPFLPCKRFYNPYGVDKDTGKRVRMYACRLHHEKRLRRVMKEGGKWRGGEKPLDFFWSEYDEESDGLGERKNYRNVGGVGDCVNKAVKCNLKKDVVDGKTHHPITIKSSFLKRKVSTEKNQSRGQNNVDGEKATIKPECNEEENNTYIQLYSESCKKVKAEPEQ